MMVHHSIREQCLAVLGCISKSDGDGGGALLISTRAWGLHSVQWQSWKEQENTRYFEAAFGCCCCYQALTNEAVI